jgi:tripartite-type tricarboxylate transporter receptor subunit TctC
MITQGTHVFNLSLYKTLRYDPDRIVPITPISAVSNVMTVHPSNPANTPLEVAAAARAAPGQLTFASGGIGTSHASIAGVDIKHVPHLVSVDGVNRTVNGEITMGFFNLPTVIDQIKAGKLKPLAATSLARSPHLPGAPTLDASGLKGYDLVTWFGFGAPSGTPPEIVQRLRDDFAKTAADPSVKAKLDEAHRANATSGFRPPDRIRPCQMDADHRGGERQRGVIAPHRRSSARTSDSGRSCPDSEARIILRSHVSNFGIERTLANLLI